MKVLKGIRVLDLGSYITAPYAAMLLAELGADVIKVERPDSADPFRIHTESANSPFFFAFNRNKRGLTLDYTQASGLEILHKLVKASDVALINVRPGVEEKLGIGAAQLQALNPRLVYCSITGYGATGPYAKRPAYDNAGQALSGLLSRFHRGDDPRIAGPAVADSLTGLFACIGILGALHERERTGTGRKVEVNMIEAAIAFAIEPLSHYLLLGSEQPFYFRGASSQAYLFRCRDGKRIALHMSSPEKFWQALAKAIGRPDLLERYASREAKIEHYEELGRELGQVFASRDRDEWVPLLEKGDVPFAPEHTLDELEDDEQIRHLGTFADIEHPVFGKMRTVNRAIRFDGDNSSASLPPPLLGEHTDEILGEIDFTQEQIAELKTRRIV